MCGLKHVVHMHFSIDALSEMPGCYRVPGRAAVWRNVAGYIR